MSIIQAENLRKVYGDGVPVEALRGVSLTVDEGEFVAIQGPSGSGKSTLLHLLGTLDTPTEGQLRLLDTDVRSLRGDALADFRREHIGFVFQMFYLIPEMTALENVMLPLLPYKRRAGFDVEGRARQLLERVGLGERLNHLPGQLSGGEQQRVALARALINRPTLLLADEPTGNLDSRAGEEVLNLIAEMRKEYGLTVVLVTHDDEVAARAGRVIRLRDGRVVELQGETAAPRLTGA